MPIPDLMSDLAELRAEIARLQRREAALSARVEVAQDGGTLPRPGWPIARCQTSGARISTGSPPRIAV
jgi:hypothetical protein